MAVDIALRVRTKQLEDALQSIPGMTRREVRKAVRGAEREWTKMPAAARKAARQTEREISERMRLIRQNSANVFGDFINDLGDAGELLAALPPHAALAAAALATLAGGAIGIGALTYGMYELVTGTHEAMEAIREYEAAGVVAIAATDEQRQAAQQLDSALQVLSATAQAIRVEVGAQLAPAWRDAAVGAVALGLAVQDLTRDLSKAAGKLRSVVTEAKGIRRVALAVTTLGASEFARWISGGMDRLGGAVAGTGSTGFSGVDEYIRRARMMVGNMPSGGTAPTGPAVSRAARVASRISRTSRTSGSGSTAPSVGPFGPELSMGDTDAIMNSINEMTTPYARGMEQIRDATDQARESVDSIIGAFGSLASALSSNAQATAAAALIETIAYQAVAVARAFAEGGPFAGPIAAATAVGAIAPQIAALSRASGRSAGAAASAPSASGGRRRAPEMRRSRNPTNTITVVSEYRHELLDRAVQDSTRRVGSPLRQELRARKRSRR